MEKSAYGSDFHTHLLEQYKLYVELTDKVSERRMRTNQFYISLLSGLMALIGIVYEQGFLEGSEGVAYISFGLFGLILNLIWKINIRSYRQLNTGRFMVIHEMEQHLPYACFDREWDYLKRGKEKKSYLQLSVIEPRIPTLISIPYAVLLIVGITKLM